MARDETTAIAATSQPGVRQGETGWVKSHPSKAFPREHAIGELAFQCEILRGAPNEAGIVLTNATGASSGALTAVAGTASYPNIAVGKSLEPAEDAENENSLPDGAAVQGVALPVFMGSGMTRQHHTPQTSSVDLEGLDLDADGIGQLFFEAYSYLYHRSARFHYPAESMPPSDASMHSVREEFAALSTAASDVCRAKAAARYEASDGPWPEERHPTDPSKTRPMDLTFDGMRYVKEASIVEAAGSRMRSSYQLRGKGQMYSSLKRLGMPTCVKEQRNLGGRRRDQATHVSWAGSEHLIASYRSGFVAVLHATHGEGVRGFVRASNHLNSGCCAGLCTGSKESLPTIIATGGLHNTIELWRLDEGVRIFGPAAPLTLLTGHVGYISALAFVTHGEGGSAGGASQLLSASGDGTCRLWDVTRGQTVLSLLGHQADVTGLRVPSECGGRLACSSSLDGTARVWDLRSGGCVRVFECPETHEQLQAAASTAEAVDMTCDGSLVAAALRYGWATFDVRGYGTIGHGRWVQQMSSIAFVGRGDACVVGNEYGGMRVVDTHHPERRHPLFECSPGGVFDHRFATHAELALCYDRVSVLASCPDGSERFASASLGGAVRWWAWTRDAKEMKPPGLRSAARADVGNHGHTCSSCCLC